MGPAAVEIPTVAPKKPNARPLRAPEQLLDERGVLRRERPRGDPLRQPGEDEQRGAERGPGQGAEQDESGEGDHEHAPAADRVAQPPGRHQREPERQRVSRDHPLHLGRRRAEAPLHRRKCDGQTHSAFQRLGSSPSSPHPGAPRLASVVSVVSERVMAPVYVAPPLWQSERPTEPED